MRLTVDPVDPTPPYEQLRRQLLDLVGAGELRAGERLPPLRQLAGDLGLAVGTVARAYRVLEAEGVLESRRGAGTRVAAGVRALPESQRRERLVELAESYRRQGHALGFTDEDLRAVLSPAPRAGRAGG